MNSKKRLHSYQAAASAFGGRLQRPFDQHSPVLASTSLPSVGGYTSARHESFRIHEIVSIAQAYTQVAGSFDAETGNWTTIATSVIEGLNVSNIFFADRIVAQISLEHPAEGIHPRVSFLGTELIGLRVGGSQLTPSLQLGLFENEATGGFPKQSYLKNAKLVNAASEQSKKFAKFWLGKKDADGERLRGMEYLNQDGENSKDEVAQRGSVLCSLVGEIEGKCAGTSGGNAIYIPDFGRLFLGELTVGSDSFDLTMLRLDLGSPIMGQFSGGQASVGGFTRGASEPGGRSGGETPTGAAPAPPGKGGPIGGNIGTT